eukprot:CAMPEP_0204346678 /NCGR_PEP_ID=MMETSP0469-20131031/27364_1 /ASSEMBLY_ACC=CAM_ASM_000384 /TAXON_ID=2969 /ORGANISM="Oxyrrhis marina" /LENGTH=68 /DNA_ID=CAMNT_0051332341 /DNA_START=6 /DNA_END=209 /DNA_ORIENTATION=-
MSREPANDDSGESSGQRHAPAGGRQGAELVASRRSPPSAAGWGQCSGTPARLWGGPPRWAGGAGRCGS